MITGRRRYRATWRGKLVLQVEEKSRVPTCRFGDYHNVLTWRDATVEDLMVIPANAQPFEVDKNT